MKGLKALVVGVKGIGRRHASLLKTLPEYELVGLVDRSPEIAAEVSGELGVPWSGDLREAIAAHGAEVVVVATPNDSHASLTILAAEAGVKGVYCEKPMAVHLRDARAMTSACRRAGTALAVNHQRRMLPVFREARRIMESGQIGEVSLIRASCAGDLLSDGTHLIDSLRFLAGDAKVEWVCGQVFGLPEQTEEAEGQGFEKAGGRRFGHPVEDAALAVIQFEGGIRAEIATGSLFPSGRFYQDFEVFGSLGRIWRKSDPLHPNLWIQDQESGGYREAPYTTTEHDIEEPLRLFAKMVLEGAAHPLSGESGLEDMEVITAIYESARIRKPVTLPCPQDQFPLELML